MMDELYQDWQRAIAFDDILDERQEQRGPARICQECHQRPAVYVRPNRGRRKADAGHDLCGACERRRRQANEQRAASAADCMRSTSRQRTCDVCGIVPAVLHVPMRQRGAFCAVHCPVCGQGVKAA